MSVRALLRRTLRSTRGATAVEYGLICAMIVLVMIVSLKLLAQDTIGMWSNISTKVSSAS